MQASTQAAVPIAFGGALSAKCFARVQRACLPWWARAWVTLPCLVYLFVFMGHDLDERVAHPVNVIVDLLSMIPLLLLYWAFIRYVRRRSWKQMTALHGAVAGSADDDGIVWKTDLNEARFGWAKFTKMRKDTDLLLLFYTPRCALYFPRTFFASEGQWQAFEALAARKMTAAGA